MNCFFLVYQEGVLVAERKPDGTKIFIHPDHKGSANLVSDANGNAIENTSYAPFGVILKGGNASRYSYESKEFDSAVDNFDFHFRKYNPQWGKFTQPDTVIQNVYDPQSLNRYAFERNNPYKNVDPSGHCVDFCIIEGLLLII